MKRRDFLKAGAATATLPVLLGGFPVQAIGMTPQMAALTNMATETDRVLVLVQLNGGNDGLNTLIPLDQYSSLSRVRASILLPESKVLKLADITGLHPSMTGMQSLFLNRKMAVVQSVGYPDPNFSHFRATDIWTSASASDQVISTGWLGRYLDQEYRGYPNGYPNTEMPDPLAITIGSVVSTTCQGLTTNLGMAITDPEAFSKLLTGGVDDAPNTPYGHELTFLRQTIQQTNLYLEVIQNAAGKAKNLSYKYPPQGQNPLADQLRVVARLIAGGLQTRIYVVNLGGFDTHANQVENGNTTAGYHALLLSRLSEAVSAFQSDLELLDIDKRVVGMTFSEFGRRIGANGSLGTDHGAAAPLFVFGSQVNARILGDNPTIPSNATAADSVPMQYDFRSVYGSVLMDWFNVEKSVIQEILFDEFEHVEVIKISTYEPKAGDLILLQNYPNPFESLTFIGFRTGGGRVKISVLDTAGREVRILTDQTYDPGEYELSFDPHGLTRGTYYYRMLEGEKQMTKVMVYK